ncbi:dienelactone hydrolase [Amylocystis lapponica]|nr:dienelactone hydrolase [Amylocystis lapponica]
MACADCVSGSLHAGTPVGQEITIAGLSTYAVGDETSKRIVVFGVDIFGWKFNNTRLLADEYATRGFRVLVPDLFDGYELPTWTLSARDPVNDAPTLFQRVFARPLSLFVLVPFVLRNSGAAQSAKIGAFVAALSTEHPAAKIGFVGFCWGGRYAITMNSSFDASVAAHPSLVKFPEDLADVSKPISFALAEHDHGYGRERGTETEKTLKEKGVADLEVVVYEGVNHGWTIRGNLADPQKKEARDKARDQALAWFDRFLTVEGDQVAEG